LVTAVRRMTGMDLVAWSCRNSWKARPRRRRTGKPSEPLGEGTRKGSPGSTSSARPGRALAPLAGASLSSACPAVGGADDLELVLQDVAHELDGIRFIVSDKDDLLLSRHCSPPSLAGFDRLSPGCPSQTGTRGRDCRKAGKPCIGESCCACTNIRLCPTPTHGLYADRETSVNQKRGSPAPGRGGAGSLDLRAPGSHDARGARPWRTKAPQRGEDAPV
jgi:hypothetical protein